MMWSTSVRSKSFILRNCVCGLKTTPENHRQKISYKTRYHWFLDLQKSRQRARYPWIPREPATKAEIDGQLVELPEMTLEYIVPKSLSQSELKPYVEWRAETPMTPALTARRLFDQKYFSNIQETIKQGVGTDGIIGRIKSQ
ncbi:39S ribosomal protein L41 mitochondrial [Fasciola gigantica]|uniref:39S ribosomal protein L41 mitochondrial n=1 Tax=Fasciola gigantica TaxID=46835 RepID=A0A504Z409_FASGI|nr:39S ribosomal protein L41 mitochondrial [Fasciola gigantica]